MAALFALPLHGLGVMVGFECVLANPIRPGPVIVCHRVMVDPVLDAAHIWILVSEFSA